METKAILKYLLTGVFSICFGQVAHAQTTVTFSPVNSTYGSGYLEYHNGIITSYTKGSGDILFVNSNYGTKDRKSVV